MRKFFVVGSGIVSIVLLLLASVDAWADDKPENNNRSDKWTTVYGTVWGLTLAQDGSGFYNEIFRDLVADDAVDHVDYKLMPYRRARTQFLNGKSACLYPSARQVLKAGGQDVGRPLLESRAIFMAQEHLFAPSGSKPPHSLADLKGKTVAVPTGSVMLALLKDSGARMITVHDEAAKAQMLITGRVDLMSGMLPNEHLIFSSMGTRMASYDREFTLLEAGIAVVCHDTPENREFMAHLDDRIHALQAKAAFRDKLAAAGVVEVPYMGAAELNDIAPAAGNKLRFVHPGRRLPFNNIR